MPYLSREALVGLKAYVYKPGGYTWLDNLHQPFWNWLVNQLPFWVAPNLITLVGLLGVCLTYLLIFCFQPDFAGSSPSWVLVLAGISICIYANLDCIDGKQARRTQSSSPLGQLFDHGCDAYIVHLLIGDMIACLGASCGWRAALGSLWIMCPWMLAQLEEYHTGVMLYGNGLWGVLEALYSTAGVCFVTAFVGPSFWTTPVFFLPSEWNISFADLVVTVLMFSCGSQIIGQVWRILLWDSSTMSATERGNKSLGFSNALGHFLLVFVLLATGTLWILTAQERECRLAYSAYGTVYALVATQLIVAHMAKTEFAPLWWCLPSFSLLAVNSVLRLSDPYWIVLASCVVYNAAYAHYVFSVVQQICLYLDIWCLSIQKRGKE